MHTRNPAIVPLQLSTPATVNLCSWRRFYWNYEVLKFPMDLHTSNLGSMVTFSELKGFKIVAKIRANCFRICQTNIQLFIHWLTFQRYIIELALNESSFVNLQRLNCESPSQLWFHAMLKSVTLIWNKKSFYPFLQHLNSNCILIKVRNLPPSACSELHLFY